jgi:hypothetical protein
MSDLEERDIGVEEWREYEWDYLLEGEKHTKIYKINSPKKVYFRKGGTTHRVTDGRGITHCVPAPGQQGCVLRWDGPVIF